MAWNAAAAPKLRFHNQALNFVQFAFVAIRSVLMKNFSIDFMANELCFWITFPKATCQKRLPLGTSGSDVLVKCHMIKFIFGASNPVNDSENWINLKWKSKLSVPVSNQKTSCDLIPVS